MQIYRLLFVSFFVILCVCTVEDFSAENKARGVKFCTVVYQRSGQVIAHFRELCSPRSLKSNELASARAPSASGNISHRCGLGSACVDIRPSPKTDVLV